MIKKKLKKCSGTHSYTKGEGCNKPVYSRHYGLCNFCWAHWLITTEKGREKLKKTQLTAKRKVKADLAKEKRKAKESITDYKVKLQSKINEIVRLIDNGLPCLAKGIYAKQIHAGHIYSRGAEPSMRYNLHNIHRQSAQSNHFQNEDGLLREQLKKEYGVEYFEFITGLRRITPLKFTNDEYKQFHIKACGIALKLKADDKIYSLQERIKLRNKVNAQMSIYKLINCIFKYTL